VGGLSRVDWGHAKGRSPKARTPARVGAVLGGSLLAHMWCNFFASAPGGRETPYNLAGSRRIARTA
jgi:hypothetical protein